MIKLDEIKGGKFYIVECVRNNGEKHYRIYKHGLLSRIGIFNDINQVALYQYYHGYIGYIKWFNSAEEISEMLKELHDFYQERIAADNGRKMKSMEIIRMVDVEKL